MSTEDRKSLDDRKSLEDSQSPRVLDRSQEDWQLQEGEDRRLTLLRITHNSKRRREAGVNIYWKIPHPKVGGRDYEKEEKNKRKM
jgi:hypothetical protein